MSTAFAMWFVACGGSRFQSDEGAGGSSGNTGSGGKGSGGKAGSSGGASSSGGAIGNGGTLGVSGGSSVGGFGGEPSAGGGPPGGAPSGGSGGEPSGGTAGFTVAGTTGTGGGMTVSCATDPNCFNCCRGTIGNAAFAGVVYECACSGTCNDVCLNHCEGAAISEGCEFCVISEFENVSASSLCANDREQCDGNTECTKYWNCLSSCEP